MNAASSRHAAAIQTISDWLRVLLAPDQLTELRALDCRKQGSDYSWTDSGYFHADHIDSLASHSHGYAPRFTPDASFATARGVYFVLNPIHPSLLARAANRVQRKAKESTSDKDILCRRWLPLDFDAVRPSGISSSDAEKAQSRVVALAARDFLAGLDWPQPLLADSGNGHHLLYRIDLIDADLPQSERDLIRRVLQSLAEKFNSPEVKVDVTVFNPARIWRLYGTWACKGDNLSERPWRQSRVLEVPQELRCVSMEQLRRIAGVGKAASVPPRQGSQSAASQSNCRPSSTPEHRPTQTLDAPREYHHLDVARWLSDRGVVYRHIANAIGDKFQLTCPFNADHKIPDAFIMQFSNGMLSAKCSHNSCAGRRWKDFKNAIGLPEPHHYDPPLQPRSVVPLVGKTDPEPPPPPPVESDEPPVPASSTDKPKIIIDVDEERVNDEAIMALSGRPNVYCRGSILVRVVHEDVPPSIQQKRGKSGRIAEIEPATLREMMATSADWMTFDHQRGLEPAHPPEWAVRAVIGRRVWPGLRYLSGIVEAPTMRPDGSILVQPGYDAATGLIYDPSCVYPDIPEKPTQEDARKASAALLELVCEFPFVAESHRAAWLAAILTIVARPAIDGPTPLFLIEASKAGGGKTLLAEVAALIAAGVDLAVQELSSNDEEVRKVLVALLLTGDRIVLFDNAAGTFGCAALDALLTSTTYQGRILGHSKQTASLPNLTVWFGTGNNLALRGDTHRRVVPIRLEPHHERPEERTGWKYPDLKGHVRQQQPVLLAAALTILRAHVVAGRPAVPLTVMGKFEAWSEVVQQAVYWTLGIDPCASRASILSESRGDDGNLGGLLDAWSRLPDGQTRGSGVTIKEALHLANLAQHVDLKDALTAWSKDATNLPDSRTLGYKLRACRGKVAAGTPVGETVTLWKLCTGGPCGRAKVAGWWVEAVDSQQLRKCG